jgi:serine phosphatase RsbU (regulator of sigma subunit)
VRTETLLSLGTSFLLIFRDKPHGLNRNLGFPILPALSPSLMAKRQKLTANTRWLFPHFYANFYPRFRMLARIIPDRSLPAPVRQPVRAETPQLSGAELASVYYAPRIAGDFFDFVRVGPDRVLFGLLDVAGNEKETDPIISAAQDTFRTVGTELFQPADINETDAMMELCLQLNRSILKAADGVRSCPAFAGCYHETLGLICYFNAGHTPGLVRDRSGVSELPATGLPLGLFSHMLFNASVVALEPGDALFLASRGVVEGKCKDDEFGLHRVKAALHDKRAAKAQDLCASILAQVEQFMCAAPTHDDVTTLALLRHCSR